MIEVTKPLDLEFRPDAFASKRVAVIGGTSGIGASISIAFALLGAEVVAAGLRSTEALSTVGDVAEVTELDVRRQSDVAGFFASIDRLDVLVNCAGVIHDRDEYQPAIFRDVLEVNLEGTMCSCLAARERLASSSGCIVNIASLTSFFGSPGAPAYGASKAAVAELTKSLAIEFAPQVRVNAVAPGLIRTNFTLSLQQDEAGSRRIVERTPAGRWGVPADLNGPILFLASGLASFVTGVVLPVDGGFSAV